MILSGSSRIKAAILYLATVLSTLWRLLPGRLRENFFFGLFVLESRQSNPAAGLRRLFALQDRLSMVINERAMAYGRGEHPKHRLTRYHDFFIDRVAENARVLDIGCGYGAVARSIARARPAAKVLGVDLDAPRLNQARAANNPPNLSFIEADVCRNLPDGGFDVVVISNVLEHIDDRVPFLRTLLVTAQPSCVLVRVPLFERDWQMPLRQELQVGYFSDPDHKIEHRLDQFQREIAEAGLKIVELSTLWGEIWAECVQRNNLS